MPVTQQHQPIGWRNELSALLRLAVPLMATQLVQVLMVFTDTLMMGLLGPAALAGGGLGAASYSFISISCVGVSVAAGSLVAMRLGAGDQRGVRQVTQAGLWLALVMGLLAGLLLSMLAPLLLGLGQQAHNVAAAMQYLQALRFALPGYLLFTVLRGYSAALGKPGPVLAITLCGSLANIALNYALLHGLAGLPRLGLFGIGLATALVMNGMALLMALYIAWQPFYRRYALLRGILRPGWAALRANLRLGLPIGAIYALESLLFVVAALCMGALGDLQLAAHQIAVQTVYVAFMLPTGIAYACTFRIGLHLPDRPAPGGRPAASGTPERTPGPGPGRSVHAGYSTAVLAGAGLAGRPVYRPACHATRRAAQSGRGIAGHRRLVRTVRWLADHRHGLSARPWRRTQHPADWPARLPRAGSATCLVPGLQYPVGCQRCVVGHGGRTGRHGPRPGASL